MSDLSAADRLRVHDHDKSMRTIIEFISEEEKFEESKDLQRKGKSLRWTRDERHENTMKYFVALQLRRSPAHTIDDW